MTVRLNPTPSTSKKPPTTAKALRALVTRPTIPGAIQLGDLCRDRISGLTGITVAFSDYLYGCRRWSLAPREAKDGKPAEWVWFDEPQVERLQANVVPVPQLDKTGGPRPDPASRATPTR